MDNFMPQLLGITKESWQGFKDIIKQKVDDVIDFIKTFPSNLINIFKSIDLFQSGQALINGFKNGIVNAFNGLKNTVKNGLSNIRKLFPFSPAKEGPFSGRGYTTYSGRALMRDFGNAILKESANVQDKTAMALSRVQGEFNSFSPKVPTAKLGISAATSQTLDVNTQLSSGAAAKSMATALMTAMEDGVKLSLDPRSNEAILNFNDSGRRSLRR
jgi:phage tape measure protein